MPMPLPKLGVGLNYQADFLPFLEKHSAAFDYLEVVPDIFWQDQGLGAHPRYVEDVPGWAWLRSQEKPLVAHSIGLSIGSAHRFHRDHLQQMERFRAEFHCPWHSDHLSFHLTPHPEAAALLPTPSGNAPGSSALQEAPLQETNIGITMPLPRDRATLAMLLPRLAEVHQRVNAPFLLENNVYFFELAGQEFREAEFLNLLCRESGCGLLLDLHNLYTNSRNAGVDAWDFLAELDLQHVAEIHLAGGQEYEGFYLDSHSGGTPKAVWAYLEYVLPRAPHLAGLTFELFGSWYPEMGEGRLLRELERMRKLWEKHQGPRTGRNAARKAAAATS